MEKDEEEILFEVDENQNVLDLEDENERVHEVNDGDASANVAEKHATYEKRKLDDTLDSDCTQRCRGGQN